MLKNRFLYFLEAFGLLASIYVIIQFVPKDVFNPLPATGGDTGSHFWPVKILHDYGIPHGIIRAWNPGNNGGEGILVHYFPFPFVLMAVLGYVLPLGMAFNLGTILPVLTLPLSVWAALRLMALPYSASVLGAMFSSAVVLNEGYKMWGGNGLSTMAGQFAHMYALNFLVLGVAFFWRELNRQKLPWASAIFFSLVALSHGYIFFGVPFLILTCVLLNPTRTFNYRLILGSLTGLLTLLLSAWFVGPMIQTNAWNTPHSFSWVFQDWVREILPPIFDPVIVSVVVSILYLLVKGLKTNDFFPLRLIVLWIVAGLSYIFLFFIFRRLGLVDVRAIPQTQLFWAIGAGVLVGTVLNSMSLRVGGGFLLAFLIFLFFFTGKQVVVFPASMKWNYTGWNVKRGYADLLQLTDKIRGNLSQPRIAYEHNLKANQVGTERVFEMLPYFANRATTESLYLQSTVLAPMIYSFTSEIGEVASCPFRKWPCMRFRLKDSEDHMELLGVQQLILSSEPSLREASGAKFLKKIFSVGAWTVYERKEPVTMADTFLKAPTVINFEGWREAAWNWYLKQKKDNTFLITAESFDSLPLESERVANKACHPSTVVDFSGITLKTDCPGVAHYLKYAYHPSFTSSGGEKLFIVSPGFLGIVPKSSEVRLSFGTSRSWDLFRWLSIVSFLGLGVTVILEYCGAFRKFVVSDLKEPEKVSFFFGTNKLRRNLSVALFVSGYVMFSVMTGSFLFWKWRDFHLNDFEVISAKQGWGALRKNTDLEGKPIKVRGINYPSGLATHAPSEIVLKLKKQFSRISGICGYPDSKFTATIQCQVRGRNRVLFTSPPLDDQNRLASFSVPAGGETELMLSVRSLKNNIDFAHAVWVELKGEE